MQLIVQGHGIEITAPLRDYAEKKIGKLSKFYSNIQKFEIILDARHNKDFKRTQVAEVSIWVSGKRVLRATAGAMDMYSAIDMVFEKLAEQIKKHKGMHVDEIRRTGEKFKEKIQAMFPLGGKIGPSGSLDEPLIVRVRRMADKPMDYQEAKAELEATDMEFILYFDADDHVYHVASRTGKKCSQCTPKTRGIKKTTPEAVAKELKKSKKEFICFFNSNTKEMNVIYKRRSGNFGLVEPIL